MYKCAFIITLLLLMNISHSKAEELDQLSCSHFEKEYADKLSMAECSPQMRHFSDECELQKKYRILKDEYSKLHPKISIDSLAGYRGLRLFNQSDFERYESKRNSDHPLKVWEIYGKSTLKYWERGNYYLNLISKKLTSQLSAGNEINLTLDDLTSLHQLYLPVEHTIPPAFRKIPILAKLLTNANIITPPGTIKGKNATQIGLSFLVNNMSDKDLKALSEDKGLKSQDGSSLIKIQPSKTTRNGFHQVTITFLDPARTSNELKDLVKDFNEGLNHFIKQGNHTSHGVDDYKYKDETPIEFSARIQRKLIGIHPFHEGVGRMSRYIQDIISDVLDLPYIPGGMLQSDISIPLSTYSTRTKNAALVTIKNLYECLKQYRCSKSYPIEPRCLPIYESNKDLVHEIKDSIVKDYLKDKSECFLNTGNSEIEAQSSHLVKFVESMEQWFDKIDGRVLNHSQLFNRENKIKLIEKLAKPLEKPLTTYTWVGGDTKAENRIGVFGKKVLAKVPVFRKKFIDKNVPDLKKAASVAGMGQYASKSASDSYSYSLPTDIGKRMNSNFGRLMVVKIQKGQRVLDSESKDLNYAHNKSLLYRDDMTSGNLTEIHRLPADVMIEKYHKPDEWVNIRLRGANAYKISDANSNDVLAMELTQMSEIAIQLYRKQDFITRLMEEARWKCLNTAERKKVLATFEKDCKKIGVEECAPLERIDENCNFLKNELYKIRDPKKYIPKEIIQDGVANSKYYTRDYNTDGGAYSDHAPVVYGNTMTWNIAYQATPLSHGKYKNHQFINKSAETKREYFSRLKRIVDAIAEMMNHRSEDSRSSLTQAFLQELPDANTEFSTFLADELLKYKLVLKRHPQGSMGVVVPDESENRMKLLEDKLDRSMMQKVIHGVKRGMQRIYNKKKIETLDRMNSFFNESDQTVYVNIHAIGGLGGKQLCKIMEEKGKKLFQLNSEIKTIRFIGDFNHSASEIVASCNKLTVHSTQDESSYSAGINDDNPKNIDLMVEMKKSEGAIE